MADTGTCIQAMELLNAVFNSPIILNDGHEILVRLEAGDEVVDIVEELAAKFGQDIGAEEIRQVVETWPPLHREAAAEMVRWALSKLDTEDRVTINWKGDDENPEIVTKFELRDHTLLIEFAHPPARVQAAKGSA